MTVSRVVHHRQVTFETVLGALCAYVLVGLMFAFFYPIQVLSTVGVFLLVVLAIYESCVIWKKRHPARH